MSTTAVGTRILPTYDIVIVGAGMIGSSAAHHTTKMFLDGRRPTVCLIGPEEPQSRQGRTIFGAHYDEGRITRVTATDSLWSVLAKLSISRYRKLEQETGVRFYEEVGCLTIGNKSSEFIKSNMESAARCHSEFRYLSDDELLSKFQYLEHRSGSSRSSIFGGVAAAILEPADAGYVNPRKLCRAQQIAAERHGCHILRDVVSDVVEDVHGSTDAPMKVSTDGGLTVRARKVLIATGAFTDFRRLLPPGVHLELQYLTQSVIFAELASADIERMRDMPSIIVQNLELGKSVKTEWEDEFDCYILPPITYPDGKTYLKLGHGCQLERLLQSPNDIIQWYQSPVPENDRQLLRTILKSVFPDLKPLSVHYDNCVTSHTTSRRPFIDLLTPSLGVALGGNGYAAKSSDEIGRMAADLLVTGKWSHELPRESFRAVMEPVSKL